MNGHCETKLTFGLTLLAVVGATMLAACAPSVSDLGVGGRNESGGVDAPPVAGMDEDWGLEPNRLNYFEGLLKGEAQRQVLCSRGNQDRVSKWLCPTDGSPAPTINKLEDVLVGLQLKDPAQPANMLFAISGHSSSLVTRKTTSINPRAVIFTAQGTVDYVALGFVRGDGFAEIVAFDPAKQDLNFFLLKIEKACDPECSNVDRFGPEAEKNWTLATVYGDQDLKNTVLDCLQCHQPGGLQAKRMLRMQELQDPWTHWFRANRPSVALLNEFQAAHPNEDYAGIPANLIRNSDPADLEKFVRGGGFDLQPNQFRTANIAAEGPRGPVWMSLYEKTLIGEMIAVPYHQISPYDPAKITAASESYKAVVAGTAAADTMADMTDVFLDSAIADLGFTAAPGLTAKQIVQHRCGTCHNGTFPGVSRNNFVVSDFPANLTEPMRQKVLQRITLPHSSRLRMPPLMFSELSADQIALIQTELGAP